MIPPKRLFGQRGKLRAFVGINADGNKIYSTISTLDPFTIESYDSAKGEYTIKCRFEPTISTSRSQLDEVKAYKGTIFLLGTDVPTQSTVEFEGKKYIVGECIKHYSTVGISYLEVLLT